MARNPACPRTASTTFRFLELPREIREMVYKYALSLDSIDRHFKRYLESGRQPQIVNLCCSPIWLMNRKTHEEVATVRQSLVLSCGVPRLSLTAFITAHRLQRLTRIVISDSSFVDLETQPGDLNFLLRAVSDIAKALRKGHQLESIKVSLKSQYLSDKLSNNQARRWTGKFCRYLRELRGIRKVDVDIDLPEREKQTLINTMTSRAQYLLSLPFSIRKQIYLYAADYNDAVKYMRGTSSVRMTTPTILQLNHQTSDEAIQAIFSVPLLLSGVAGARSSLITVTDYISVETMKRIKWAYLKFVRSKQLQVLEQLVPLFNEGCLLSTLRIHYHEPSIRELCRARGKIYPTDDIRQCLEPLEHLRVGGSAIISGTLPKCYSEPLSLNMMSSLDGRPPYRLYGILPSGEKTTLSSGSAWRQGLTARCSTNSGVFLSSQIPPPDDDASGFLRDLDDSELRWSDHNSSSEDEPDSSDDIQSSTLNLSLRNMSRTCRL